MSAAWEADLAVRWPRGPQITAALSGPMGAAHSTVLFGPSGGGKSTILRAMAGLERIESGRIVVDGVVWADASAGIHQPPQARDVGMSFQDYALFPHLGAADNIAFGLRDRPAAERRARLDELLGAFGLEGLERRLPRELSGGQQQRVALARAVARRPRMLLLDEPLSALDGVARQSARSELRRQLAAFGIPSILVTHDPTDAIALGDAIAVIADGRVVQSGSVEDVFSRPSHVSVARIVGTETVLAGHIEEVVDGLAGVRAADVRFLAAAPDVATKDVHVCIRADAVTLARGVAPTSARNTFGGRVTAVTAEGPLFRVDVDCGVPLAALVTRQAIEDLEIAVGASITAAVKASAVHLIPRAGATGT